MELSTVSTVRAYTVSSSLKVFVGFWVVVPDVQAKVTRLLCGVFVDIWDLRIEYGLMDILVDSAFADAPVDRGLRVLIESVGVVVVWLKRLVDD